MLLELSKQNAVVTCFAPNIEQTHVINHTTGNEEVRSVFVTCYVVMKNIVCQWCWRWQRRGKKCVYDLLYRFEE